MAMTNKFAATCCACGKVVGVGEGLTEKRSTLGFSGDGWLTRHQQCVFMAPRLAPRWQWQKDRAPEQVVCHDDPWDPGNPHYGGTYYGMTESEFFGGDVGDKG